MARRQPSVLRTSADTPAATQREVTDRLALAPAAEDRAVAEGLAVVERPLAAVVALTVAAVALLPALAAVRLPLVPEAAQRTTEPVCGETQLA